MKIPRILKIRRKPIELRAVQLERGKEIDVLHFIAKDLPSITLKRDGIIIKTLEGDHLARYGDYIIKGVKGEFYPCKPDIFSQIYDIVGDTDD